MANKISYVKNEEPAFIKAFKQKVGYQEGPDVDTKREVLSYEDEDRSDNEDEKPVVVVLKGGDLTAEEADIEMKKSGQQQETMKDLESTEDSEPPEDGKITFKKPAKRQSDSSNELRASSSKKQKEEKKSKKSSSKDVKNKSLLSFDDEEEEDT